jgi:hypothetical protein
MRSYSSKRRVFVASVDGLEERKAPSSIGVVQNVVAPVSLVTTYANSTAHATGLSSSIQNAASVNTISQGASASVSGSLLVSQTLTGPGSSISNASAQTANASLLSQANQYAVSTNQVTQPTSATISNSAGVSQTVAGGQSQITNTSLQDAHASFGSTVNQYASPTTSTYQNVSASVS